MLIDEVDIVTRIQVQAILSCLEAGVDYQAGRIGRMMRTISESLHLVQYHSPVSEPKYKDSTELKRINLFVSYEASRLIVGTRKNFEAATVLEHPLPLDIMYPNLKALPKVTSSNIIELLARWPLVTVTKDEDSELEHRGWVSPVERYETAKILVGRVKAIEFGKEPTWTAITLSDRSSWLPTS